MSIEELLTKIDSLPPNFLLNNKLIKHGYIDYLSKTKTIKKKYLFLYSNGLLLTTPRYGSNENIKKFKIKNFLQTKSSVRVEDLPDHEFMLTIPVIKKGIENAKSIHFSLPTIIEKHEWIKEIMRIFYTSPKRTYSTDVLVSPRCKISSSSSISSSQLDCYDYAINNCPITPRSSKTSISSSSINIISSHSIINSDCSGSPNSQPHTPRSNISSSAFVIKTSADLEKINNS